MRPSTSTSLYRTALQPRKCAAHHVACRTLITSTASRTRPSTNAVALGYQSRRRFATEAHVEPKNPKNIAVIGGGITGLSTAHYLAKYATKGTKITLYEADDRLGGWINTQHAELEYDGKKGRVRFERGPRTLRSYAKDTWKMDDLVLYDLLRDIELEPIFRQGGNRYIALGDEVVALTPKNLISHPSLRGIWKALWSAFWYMKRNRIGSFQLVGHVKQLLEHKDPSIAKTVSSWTNSSPLADQLVSAVMHGVWGGNIDRLSMAEAMPKLYWNFLFKDGAEWVHMPLWEAKLVQAAQMDQRIMEMVRRSAQGPLLMFTDGMGALPKAIEKGLAANPAVDIKTGTRIKRLEYDARADQVMVSTSRGRPQAYDKVISTIYSKDLSSLAPNLPSLADSEAVTITAVNIWLPEPGLNAANRGLGYLVPRNDGGFHDSHGLLGVFFDSDVLIRPEGEPEGTKLFLLFRGSIPEEEAKTVSRQILATHLGIDPSIPAIALHSINQNCIPQHHVGHRPRMAAAASEISHAFAGRLAVAGPSYTSTGVVGSIRAGHDVAAHVTGSSQPHVGPTGLSRFLGSWMPEMAAVSRKTLVVMGRRISETIPLWMQLLR